MSWLFGIGPAIIGAVLGAYFLKYQDLQFKYKTKHRDDDRDDSYLDVRETATTISIAFIITLLLVFVGLVSWPVLGGL